jgi:hypothetical protein
MLRMVIWSNYLASIAAAFGTSSTEAGIIFSLTFTIGLIAFGLIATEGRRSEVSVPYISLFTTILFTFMGWYPIWLGSVMALVISILLAKIIAGGF